MISKNVGSDTSLPKLSPLDFKLVEKLLNYRKYSTVGKRTVLKDQRFVGDNGWLFNRDICDGTLDSNHRSGYMNNRILSKGLIEKERVIFKNKQGRITEEGLIVYRLKRDIDTVRKIFLIFYANGKFWDVAESDYFNDNLYDQIRSTVIHNNALTQILFYKEAFQHKGIKVYISPDIFKSYVETFFKLYSRTQIVPPLLIYYLLTSGKLPNFISPEDAYLSFLIQDYLACNNDGWRNKLRTAINNIKKEGGK